MGTVEPPPAVTFKSASVEILCKCIRCVHDGQIWANGAELELALAALSSSPGIRAVDARGMNLLSTREREVVRCVAEGMTNNEIGRRLGLSKHTVKNYLLRIFDKLGVSNRVELLFFTLSQPVPLEYPASEPDNGPRVVGSKAAGEGPTAAGWGTTPEGISDAESGAAAWPHATAKPALPAADGSNGRTRLATGSSGQ